MLHTRPFGLHELLIFSLNSLGVKAQMKYLEKMRTLL